MKNRFLTTNAHFPFAVKRAIACFIAFCVLFGLLPNVAFAESALTSDYLQIAQDIVAWKKAQVGKNADQYLLEGEFLNNAATYNGDWTAFGLARLGAQDDFLSYLAVVSDKVSKAYGAFIT